MGQSIFSSLRAKFLTVILPLYLSAFALIFGIYEAVNYDAAREELTQRMQRLAASQSIILAHPVAMRDTEHVGLMLATIISDRDLVGVTVFDDQSEVLDTFGETSASNELTHRVTINYADGDAFRRVGDLQLIMSTDRLIEEAKTRLFHSAGLAFALLLAVIIGSMIAYDRIVSKPLSYLLSAFRRTDSQDLKAVDWKSRDELGDMVLAFNEMTARLMDYKSRVLADQNELEHRVAERTQELTEAQERAEAANRAKSRFLSSMSHELRTPLNAILGFGQLLQKSDDEKLSPRQEEHVADIMNGGRHLLLLIEEVLDLAKIEDGELRLDVEPVSPSSIITECVTLTSPLAAGKSITVVQDPDYEGLRADADLIRLKQVVLNLISNAIKYNADNGSVTISVSKLDSDRIRISVSDTGFGIAVHRQAELFEPFARLGAEATQTQGSGIGLTISKRLTEAMNGTIGFSSIEGAGSTFWVDLPAAAPVETAKTLAASVEKDLEPRVEARGTDSDGISMSTLYIEDHPVNLRLMQRIVDQVDYVYLTIAMNAEDGLRLAAEMKPDLILTDIHLPGMSGFDVLREVRSNSELKGIPVVAISADSVPQDVQKDGNAGFDAYLAKPIQVREILEVFESARQRLELLNAAATTERQ